MFRRITASVLLTDGVGRKGGKKTDARSQGSCRGACGDPARACCERQPWEGERQRQGPGASCICGRRRRGDGEQRRLPRPIGARQGRRRTRAGRRSGGRRGTPLEGTIRLGRCVRIPRRSARPSARRWATRPSPRSTASTTTRQTRSGSAFPRRPASGTVSAPATKGRRPRPTTHRHWLRSRAVHVRPGARVLPRGRAVDEGVALARDNLRRVLRRRAEPPPKRASTQKSRPRLRPPRATAFSR